MNDLNSIIKVIKTADGSRTLYHKQFNEIYHSRHGAYQESIHVFIQAGLKNIDDRFADLHILEIGFGTGLNCMLTYTNKNSTIHYTGIDNLPVNWAIIEALQYPKLVEISDELNVYQNIINSKWNHSHQISPDFYLNKIQSSIFEIDLKEEYHLIYFDAFAPATQPEMWEQPLFEKMYACMLKGGCLVTYCAKGQVRRNMEQAGLTVERIPGPPGKREMLRAIKLS